VEERAALLQEVLSEAGIAAFEVAKEQRDESGARGFPVNEWFDWECKDARRRLKEALRREGSAVAEELRKKYRAVIWQKKRMFSKTRTAQLLELAKRQPAKFWGRFKKRIKRVGVQSKAEWHGYCKGLYTG
jgi:succinate dehydrogenase/fumarate reductase flavoprotein subunit